MSWVECPNSFRVKTAFFEYQYNSAYEALFLFEIKKKKLNQNCELAITETGGHKAKHSRAYKATEPNKVLKGPLYY